MFKRFKKPKKKPLFEVFTSSEELSEKIAELTPDHQKLSVSYLKTLENQAASFIANLKMQETLCKRCLDITTKLNAAK